VGVSREYISMIENGKRAVTKRALLYNLACALNVSITDLTGQPVMPRTAEEHAAYVVAPAIRHALDGFDEAPTPRSVQHLAEVSQWAMSARMARDLPTLGRILPGLVAETAVLAEDGDEQAVALHAQACVTAALALKPLSIDLARRAAERATLYADRLGDPAHIGAAGFASAQTIMAGGSRRVSLAVAERAADRVQPGATTDDARAWYGMLHLHAALSAASVGRSDHANAHLDEAASVASTVDGDPWHMEFSPANVEVWRVGVALENGEPERAPEHARRVEQGKLRSIDRRTRLHIDAARGLYVTGHQDAAVRALLTADHMAPQGVRIMTVVREIVGQMLRDTPTRGGSDELRDLATRMGLDPLSPPDEGRA
jgi:transcriptional regulator with XRE-family HTH domain